MHEDFTMTGIEEYPRTTLAKTLFPELYWFVYNQLTLVFGDHRIIRIERLLKEDAAELTWFLFKEQFVVIGRYQATERPIPWILSWREQTHARFWAEQCACFRMIENTYVPAVELLPFLNFHIQGD